MTDLDTLFERAHRRASAETSPRPDFADVSRRLQASADQGLDELDSGLAAIVERSRVRTEFGVVMDRRQRGAGQLPVRPKAETVAGPATTADRRRVAILVTLAAALVATVVGAAELGTPAGRQVQESVRHEAALSKRATGLAETAGVVVPTKQVLVRDGEGELEVAEPTVEEPAKPEVPVAAEARPKRKRAPANSTSSSLTGLLDDAEAAWSKGDLRGAEKKLLDLVSRGKSSQADLAWGDIFTLARQLHGPASEYERWGQYLRSYPRGRHADDARAGRCRLGPFAEPAQCWANYLYDFPDGAHRGEARLSEAATTGDL